MFLGDGEDEIPLFSKYLSRTGDECFHVSDRLILRVKRMVSVLTLLVGITVVKHDA